GELTPDEAAFINAAAADVKVAGKNAVVAAGSHLTPETQAVALAINSAVGAIGNTITLLPVSVPDRPTHAEAIAALGAAMKAPGVQTVLILGGNPAYDAPPELELEKLIAAVPNSIHLSLHRNETSLACAWHLPRAHY